MMAICKDCLYVEVCSAYLLESYKRAHLLAPDPEVIRNLKCDDCEFFKDSSRFVELPCKVGDIAYIIHRSKNGGSFIQEVSVSGIHLRDKIGYRNRPRAEYLVVRGNVNLSKHINLKEIGKTVFFTREEAEQALKERESE